MFNDSAPTSSFASLNLHPALLNNLPTLGYDDMTPIQAQSLPHILAGKDVIAQGKTGSGKTAAYGLGLFNRVNVKEFRIQSLVVCPTRELADQVAQELRKLARGVHNVKVLALCGGAALGPQIDSLTHGAHIIVGTPGRIEALLNKRILKLDHLSTLVLDEADRMLDMGFQSALDLIVSSCPVQRQTLLFSATFPREIKSIVTGMMNAPVEIKVSSTHDNKSIRQHFYKIRDDADRLSALRLILLNLKPDSTVVFCNTKIEVKQVCKALKDYGFSCMALHGDLEQPDRDQTLIRFSNKSVSILVATDVAARGLDIDSLDAVINYQLSRDLEVHVHRIGRTGRAGSKGLAVTFVAENQLYRFNKLAEYLDQTLEIQSLPQSTAVKQMPWSPKMATIEIDCGKKQKLRAGDILGALTAQGVIAGGEVGKINMLENKSYVAVAESQSKLAIKKLLSGKIKGRSFRGRLLVG